MSQEIFCKQLVQQASRGVGEGEEGNKRGLLGREGRAPLPFPFHIFLPFPHLLPFLHLSRKLLEYRGGNSSHSYQLGSRSQHNTVGDMTCSCPTQSEGRSKWLAETRFQALERSLQTSPLLVSCVTSNLQLFPTHRKGNTVRSSRNARPHWPGA